MSSSVEIPVWLTSDFLLSHLQKYFNDSELSVQNFHAKAAAIDGTNFCSLIYRVTIQFIDGQQQTHTKHLLVKAALVCDVGLDALSEYNIYDKEIEFYNEIVPRVNLLWKKLNENDRLFPEVIGICKKRKIFLFEDLNHSGFSMAPIQRGYDLPTAKLIFRKLANMHACNAVIQQEDPNVFKNFSSGIIAPTVSPMDQYFENNFDLVFDVLSEWADFPIYAEKLKRVRKDFRQKMRQTVESKPDEFNTLVHGDFWNNNILLKFRDEKAEDLVFIDFQIAHWNSPAFDLHHLLNISLEESLRPERFDELIEFYHTHLTNALKRLGYKKTVPTFAEFHQQILKRSYHGFFAACTIQPIVLNENCDGVDTELLMSNDEQALKRKRLMFSSPRTQACLKKLIPFFDRMGCFD